MARGGPLGLAPETLWFLRESVCPANAALPQHRLSLRLNGPPGGELGKDESTGGQWPVGMWMHETRAVRATRSRLTVFAALGIPEFDHFLWVEARPSCQSPNTSTAILPGSSQAPSSSGDAIRRFGRKHHPLRPEKEMEFQSSIRSQARQNRPPLQGLAAPVPKVEGALGRSRLRCSTNNGSVFPIDAAQQWP
ncbi:hypothetical protein BO71DRAFT_430485 [Aspergillus ellipticus CBS 707.79]|uniref:Uncharacterized protein n=1 Tax=Aspergillus ellipticus CBS 707.79 TaxID=1448320 RepID=A0A319DIR6_9EURO|nr:hypothetical protein BO71DRAFT_430485 [Aspergillus ellipticus CBS 707.79]